MVVHNVLELALLTDAISFEAVLSTLSLAITLYFWLVQARRERPRLSFHQLRDFRVTRRRGDSEDTQRLGLTQVQPCGVLVVNHSTRQNSIIRFECYLRHEGRPIRGSWGYVNEDAPPWNLAPESTLALQLACFYDVPTDLQVTDETDFLVVFETASGKRFSHVFRVRTPREEEADDTLAVAA